MRLKILMIAVLVIALLLGVGVSLRQRARQFDRLSFVQSREANRWENRLETSPNSATSVLILRRVHWHDTVAASYQQIAQRPWLFAQPDPSKIACECRTCQSRYPGSGLSDQP